MVLFLGLVNKVVWLLVFYVESAIVGSISCPWLSPHITFSEIKMLQLELLATKPKPKIEIRTKNIFRSKQNTLLCSLYILLLSYSKDDDPNFQRLWNQGKATDHTRSQKTLNDQEIAQPTKSQLSLSQTLTNTMKQDCPKSQSLDTR